MKKRKGSKWISFLVAAALVFSLSGMTALAAAPDEGDWTDLNEYVENTGTELEEGQYYLSDRLDLEASLTLEEDADVVLDLCGSTLVGPEDGDSVIVVDASESSLTIQDSEEDGAITSYGYGLEIYDGTVALNGGSIQSCVWNGVYIVGEDALFIMNDGDISNNTANPDMAFGGGVFVGPDGSFVMLGGTIEKNEASIGGGVANFGGTFNMEEDAVISGNTAEEGGGGVANAGGEFTMDGGLISDNSAGPGGEDGAYGGGVLNAYGDEEEMEGGTFILNGGSIEDNSADDAGGGIISSGIFVMNGGTVQDNTAAVEGGGIMVFVNEEIPIPSGTDNFVMTDGEILNNAAGSGGGVCVGVYDEDDDNAAAIGGSFVMSGGTIQGNEAADEDGSGGGVLVAPESDFQMNGGTIAENEADLFGGGVCNGAGTFVMEEGAVISGNTSLTGAGVMTAGAFTMNGGLISDNSTINGGGGGGVANAYVGEEEIVIGTFTLNGGSIENNTSEYIGGGVMSAGIFEMNGGTVQNNTADEDGGGILITMDADTPIPSGTDNFVMTGGEILNNTSNDGSGGGVCLGLEANEGTAGVSFAMSGGTIQGNEALGDDGGGGVLVGADCAFLMSGGTIAENEAALGGGVANTGDVFVMEGDAVISDNTAEAAGGGVFNTIGTFFMNGGQISDNTAEAAGGGVANTYDVEDEFEGGTFYLNGGTIEDNASEGDGGGIWNSGIFQMDGGTVQDNTAGEYGGGIRLMTDEDNPIPSETDSFEMSDGEILNNSAESGSGGGVSLGSEDDSAGAAFTMSGGTIQGNQAAADGAGGVYVGPDCDFLMSGGTIAENEARVGGGVGNEAGSFAMDEDAVISGNTAEQAGGVANAGGEFVMGGGQITGNTATYGGGVITYDYDDGETHEATFFLSGGSIEENTAESYGGVYVDTGDDSFAVSGDATVKGNTANGEDNNVCLPEDTHIRLLDELTGDIYVTVENAEEESTYGRQITEEEEDTEWYKTAVDHFWPDVTFVADQMVVSGANDAGYVEFILEDYGTIDYRFVNPEKQGPTDEEISDAGLDLPEVQYYPYADGETVTATISGQAEDLIGSVVPGTVNEEPCIWTLTGWSPDEIELNSENPAGIFDGMWEFTPAYTATASYSWGEDGPDESQITFDLPSTDVFVLTDDSFDTTFNAEADALIGQSFVGTDGSFDGVWTLTGWDPETLVLSRNAPDGTFYAIWEFTPDPYTATASYSWGEDGPDESQITFDLPSTDVFEDVTEVSFETSFNAEADALIGQSFVGTSGDQDGVWTLTGWDPEEMVLSQPDPDGTFYAIWEFTPDVKDGLIKDDDGVWRLYKDNVFQGDYTGFAENEYGKWYVERGVVTFTVTDILKDRTGAIGTAGDWYYVIDSKVQENFTGLSNFSNQYGWWYIVNGKVDFTRNSVDKNVNGWWYVVGGKVQLGFTGLANYKNQYGWWYIEGGKVNFNHNGVEKNKNGWWYVTGSKVQFDFTGLANYRNDYGWWYIEGGKVNFNHTGVEKNVNGWWYVKDSKVDFSYNGTASNRYGTWNIVNGKVRFS